MDNTTDGIMPSVNIFLDCLGVSGRLEMTLYLPLLTYFVKALPNNLLQVRQDMRPRELLSR